MIVNTTDSVSEGYTGRRPKHDKSKRKRLHEIAICRTPGWESLAVAVIEQAITDYFVLRNHKAVLFGKVNEKHKKKVRHYKGLPYQATHIYGIAYSDIRELLKFLDGGVQRWADLCELDAEGWDGLMGAILRRERSGKFVTRQTATTEPD